MGGESFVLDLICVDEGQLAIGRGVPDGEGHFHRVGPKMAYCSSAREDEPHNWRRSSGIRFVDIRHADLERST